MKAVILAGGLGTRLKPFTQAIPKPLLPIGEQSLLEIQIRNLVRDGFDEVFICTNYKAAYVEQFVGDGSRLGASVRFSNWASSRRSWSVRQWAPRLSVRARAPSAVISASRAIPSRRRAKVSSGCMPPGCERSPT